MLAPKRKLNEGLVIGDVILTTIAAIDNGETPCIELSIDLPDNMTVSLPDIS